MAVLFPIIYGKLFKDLLHLHETSKIVRFMK